MVVEQVHVAFKDISAPSYNESVVDPKPLALFWRVGGSSSIHYLVYCAGCCAVGFVCTAVVQQARKIHSFFGGA